MTRRVLVIPVLALVAACGGGGSGGAGGSAGGGASSAPSAKDPVLPTPSTTAPFAPPVTSAPATTRPGPTTPGSSAAPVSALPVCASAALEAVLRAQPDAGGQHVALVVLRYRGQRFCQLSGTPTVTFSSSSGAPVGGAASKRTGPLYGSARGAVITPDSQASATLTTTSTGCTTTPATVTVTPAGGSATSARWTGGVVCSAAVGPVYRGRQTAASRS